jgi:rfaE bifunctional protein kinase chain/domain
MLTTGIIERILERLPHLRLGVVGDLFLDRYLDLDASLTEPSIETGLDAYQVTRVRSYPGAAGTVINNLVALGVGTVWPIAVIGDDGEGYELRQALGRLSAVEQRWVFSSADRRTPTYTKPMLQDSGQPARELNRLDIKNRSRLPSDDEARIIRAVDEIWHEVDALVVVDQVSEADCGVVTAGVRQRLGQLGQQTPEKMILVDSRESVGLFQAAWLKPNQNECRRAVSAAGSMEAAVEALARRTGRPVFCTCGERGILMSDPRAHSPKALEIPAYPVSGPIDIVGAGDSASAGIACAVAADTTVAEAASFGNLIASITITQLGVTGTAKPAQVRQRWADVHQGVW